MTDRFIIALTAQARRVTPRIDLAQAIAEADIFGLELVERSLGGKSVAVTMPIAIATQVRRRLPFVVVERATALPLLSYQEP